MLQHCRNVKLLLGVVPLGAQARAGFMNPLLAGGAPEGGSRPCDVAVADAARVGENGAGIWTLPRQEQEEGYDRGGVEAA